jgi:hypothetical protein
MRRGSLLVLSGLAGALIAILTTDREPAHLPTQKELRGENESRATVGRSAAAKSGAQRATESDHQSSRPEPAAFWVMSALQIPAKDLYRSEHRSPVWAPEMEARLAQRFSLSEVESAGLPGMRLTGVECRLSTCRVAIEWPDALDDDLRRRGVLVGYGHRAPHLFFQSKGPLARIHQEFGTLDNVPDGWQRLNMILVFGEADIDPIGYSRWAARIADGYARRGR